MNICPCGSNESYANCCGQYIDDKKIPQTPEILMRSRYTAFTKADANYLQSTMLPPASDDFNAEETRQWAQSIDWEKLEIISSSLENDLGYVEFIAHFKYQHEKNRIHEMSEFKKQDGRWYYVRGVMPRVSTFVNERKMGRNDPCVCGSGKKYKKCCMVTA